MIVYYGGMAYTHGSAGEPVTGQHNSGVGAAKLRMDGFVSLNAPQIFNVASLTVRETRTPIAPPRCNACTVSAPVLLSVTVLTFCLRWLLPLRRSNAIAVFAYTVHLATFLPMCP